MQCTFLDGTIKFLLASVYDFVCVELITLFYKNILYQINETKAIWVKTVLLSYDLAQRINAY